MCVCLFECGLVLFWLCGEVLFWCVCVVCSDDYDFGVVSVGL